MAEVLAYHVICCTHGFWLPNGPRGSQSTVVRAPNLQPFGPATPTGERASVAHRPHDAAKRRRAKQELVYPEVIFDGCQALSVAQGFAAMTAKSSYVIHACAILPSHVHLVVARHHYPIEQVIRLLRQQATEQLLKDGRHPFAAQWSSTGRLPSVWAQDFWKVFLFTPDEIRQKIAYVEENPVKEGKRRQHWPFITPFDPPISDASQKCCDNDPD
jgi:REP element-mobilizing transposase RayT